MLTKRCTQEAPVGMSRRGYTSWPEPLRDLESLGATSVRVFQSPVNFRCDASPFRSGPVAPQSTQMAKYRSPFSIQSEPQNGQGLASVSLVADASRLTQRSSECACAPVCLFSVIIKSYLSATRFPGASLTLFSLGAMPSAARAALSADFRDLNAMFGTAK